MKNSKYFVVMDKFIIIYYFNPVLLPNQQNLSVDFNLGYEFSFDDKIVKRRTKLKGRQKNRKSLKKEQKWKI